MSGSANAGITAGKRNDARPSPADRFETVHRRADVRLRCDRRHPTILDKDLSWMSPDTQVSTRRRGLVGCKARSNQDAVPLRKSIPEWIFVHNLERPATEKRSWFIRLRSL